VPVPLDDMAFNEAINEIKYLVEVNQINLHIDSIVSKKLTRRVLDTTTSLPREILSEKMVSSAAPRGILFKPEPGLEKFLIPTSILPMYNLKSLFCRQLKDPILKHDRSGVYRINCVQCNAAYFGETGRKLSIRIDEHKTAFNKHKLSKSAFAAF